MGNFGKLTFFFIIVCVFVIVQTKNYKFDVTYECCNNEFKWYKEKLKHQIIYGCRNWVQKILISQKKNKFVRFESEQVEEEEKIQEEEQEDFEEEQEREEEREKEEEIKEDEELLEEIEKMEKEEEEKNKMKERQQKPGSSQLTTESDSETKDSNQQLTQKLASIFHKFVPSSNPHMLSSSYHYEEDHNELRHYFLLRHNEEQEQKKQKFKPLKAHRSHPIQDVIFLLELFEMNSIIRESTYQVNYEDVPTLQELKEILKKKKQQPIKKSQQEQKPENQQKQHNFLAITKPKHLRSTIL